MNTRVNHYKGKMIPIDYHKLGDDFVYISGIGFDDEVYAVDLNGVNSRWTDPKKLSKVTEEEYKKCYQKMLDKEFPKDEANETIVCTK